jgi:hypothetical protein
MKVTDIRYQPVNTIETKAFKNAEVIKKSDVNTNSVSNSTTKDTEWQKNIILDAISSIENNIQVDNNHPLSRADYSPIESFTEAQIELAWFKTPMFATQASGAQANLTPDDVSGLFVEA